MGQAGPALSQGHSHVWIYTTGQSTLYRVESKHYDCQESLIRFVEKFQGSGNVFAHNLGCLVGNPPFVSITSSFWQYYVVKMTIVWFHRSKCGINKPAAQAAAADPSR